LRFPAVLTISAGSRYHGAGVDQPGSMPAFGQKRTPRGKANDLAREIGDWATRNDLKAVAITVDLSASSIWLRRS
jgi:hypothetical protein